MCRRLLLASCCICLVLSVGVAALWVRGNWKTDALAHYTAYHATCLIAGRSEIALARLTLDYSQVSNDSSEKVVGNPEPRSGWSVRYESVEAGLADVDWTGWAEGDGRALGPFGILTHGHPPVFNTEGQPDPLGWEISAPDWLILLLLLIPPAVASRGIVKRRLATRRGMCRSCGYDLRASKDRCPECGTPMHPGVSTA